MVDVVQVEIIDPRSVEARYCLRSYFEELGRRFDTGLGRRLWRPTARSLKPSARRIFDRSDGYASSSAIMSISTQAPNGSCATLTALREWMPRSPNTSTRSSDAPSAMW